MADSTGKAGEESMTPSSSSKIPLKGSAHASSTSSASLSLVSDLQQAFEVSEEDARVIATNTKFATEALALQQSSSESLGQAMRALEELGRLRGSTG